MEQQHDEVQDDQAQAPVPWSLGQKAAVFVPTALAACGVDAILHAPLPLAIAGVVGAYALAHKSPELYGEFRKHMPLPALPEGGPEDKEHLAGEYTITERLMGKHLQQAGQPQTPGQKPEQSEEEFRQRPRSVEDLEDDLPRPPLTRRGTFVFSSVLKGGFTPALDQMYLGSTMEGQHIYGTAQGLCHVALAGSTDGGKSGIMRLLMAQLCKAGAQVLLLNPHYTRFDLDKQEDWTPFEPYFLYDPMECRKYEHIEHYLKYTAETLLPRRLERYAHSLPLGKPYFLILDELPSIIKHIPQAPEYLGELLREGRKVGIFLIAASQDFLVRTIAPDGSGGAIRDCYRTAYYVGGDSTTARTMLDMEPKKVPEDQLGKGIVMLRCATVPAVKKAMLVRVPYVDNNALYHLLGPSSYQPSHAARREEDLDLPPATPFSSDEQEAASGQRPRLHAVSRRQQNDLASLRRPAAGLPQILRAASDAYAPGMTYRDMGAALGYGDLEAREIWLELKRRGMLRNATKATEQHEVIRETRTQKAQPEQQSELERALAAYDAGNTTQAALALALHMTPWTVRSIYSQVKKVREKEKESVS